MYKLIFTLIGLSLIVSCTSSNEKNGGEHSQMLKEVNHSEEYTTIYEDSLMQIQDAWVRVAPERGMTAGFMLIEWKDGEEDSLTNFYTDICMRHEIHETYDRGEGLMGMRQIQGVRLVEEEVAKLRPGGKHLMMMQLKKDIVKGDSVLVRLNFKQRDAVEIFFKVRAL